VAKPGHHQPVPDGRALALDLGDQRIGVAVCDSARLVATPLETLQRSGDRLIDHGRITELCDEHDIAVIVVGLPFTLTGELGPAAKSILREVKALRRRTGRSTVTHDERLTTVIAQDSLHAQGKNTRQGRAMIDQLAATVILQSWIEMNSR